jgi:hypothetical protein
VPEQVYLNRIRGEQRVHVEITAQEIPVLLADITTGLPPSATTRAFLRVLAEAHLRLNPKAVTDPGPAALPDPLAAAYRHRLSAVGTDPGRERGGHDLADEALGIIREVICGDSTEAFASAPAGPCVLSPGHGGPVHQGPEGDRWLRREAVPRTGRETVHGCPGNGSMITTCCGLTPMELPSTERFSMLPADVTCPRNRAEHGGEAPGTPPLRQP